MYQLRGALQRASPLFPMYHLHGAFPMLRLSAVNHEAGTFDRLRVGCFRLKAMRTGHLFDHYSPIAAFRGAFRQFSSSFLCFIGSILYGWHEC